MAGFGPVGSTPVAALPTGGAAGVNYTPGTATITFEGLPPTAAYPFAPTRVFAQFAEAMHPGYGSNVRAFSEFAEALHPGYGADVRAFSLYVEVLQSLSSAVVAEGSVSILW